MQKSERLGQVLAVALAGMSDPQVAKRCRDRGIDISHNPVNQMRNGEYGRIETVHRLGRGIADLLTRHFGVEILQEQGAQTEEAVADWLVSVATGRSPRPAATLAGGVDPALLARNLIAEARASYETPNDWLTKQLASLSAQRGGPISVDFRRAATNLTFEQAQEILEETKQLLEAGDID